MLNAVLNPKELGSLVWPVTISLAATLVIEFSFFSYCYLDVSVHSVPFHTLWIHVWMYKVCLYRFPHSEISGSKAVCASPKLIAAYHVFHRLLVPRHSPCALTCLTFLLNRFSLFRNVVAILHYFLESLLVTNNLVKLIYLFTISIKLTLFSLYSVFKVQLLLSIFLKGFIL